MAAGRKRALILLLSLIAFFEEAEVIRPWYGLDPTEWLYRVRLKDSGEVLVYEYNNGVFVQINR